MLNHYPFIQLTRWNKTFAFCSFKKPKKLLIFVHGFNGSAIDTWGDFQELILLEELFLETDIIFYGYDSLRSQANNLSISLFKLIDAAIHISSMPYPDRGLSEIDNYESVVLISHSLGSVISRLALLYAYDKQLNWVQQCKLVLFAPAHFGSRIPANFIDCLDGSLIFMRPFAYIWYPILIDLKEGSQLLNDLHKNSSEILSLGKGGFLKAMKVVWAEYERIVVSKRFLEDSIEIQIDNCTHISVCKASIKFIEPLIQVLEVMQQ